MTSKANFEVSLETRLLTDALLDAPVGEVVTFAALSEKVGYDTHGGDPRLQSALRRAFSMQDAVFSSVRGVGYKRLNDDEKITSVATARDRARRASKREMRKLATVEFDSLSPEMKVRHNAEMTMMNALHLFGKDSSVAKIETAVKASGQALPLGRTMEFLM